MVGDELRIARRAAGVSQDAIGRFVGLSGSEIGRIERGEAPWLSIVDAAKVLDAAGLAMWLKTFPLGEPIRDAAHAALIGRFEARLSPGISAHREWPIPIPGDRRSIDLVLTGLEVPVGVEAETRLNDEQSLEHSLNHKRRDAGLERMILLVLDSVSNRRFLDAAAGLRQAYPARTRTVLSALGTGRLPPTDGIVLL